MSCGMWPLNPNGTPMMIEIDRMPRFCGIIPPPPGMAPWDRRRQEEERWQEEQRWKEEEKEREREEKKKDDWEKFCREAEEKYLYREPPTLIPAKAFNLGPGLARELEDTSLTERFRYGDHDPYGKHLNHEVILPLLNTRRTIRFCNSHISLDDDDEL